MIKDRPHGHMGAKTTKIAADKAVLMEHFGPHYRFVQRLGGMPVIYFIIGGIVYRSWLHAIGAGIYVFLFHILATSYFAARSKIGLETLPKRSFGYFWSRLFIPRVILDHLVMLAVLIWMGSTWFLLSGIALYIIDYIITIATSLPKGGFDKNETINN